MNFVVTAISPAPGDNGLVVVSGLCNGTDNETVTFTVNGASDFFTIGRQYNVTLAE